MSFQEDLATVASDLATLQGIVERLVGEASAPDVSPNEAVVTSVVAALQTAGYTVTSPITVIPVTDGTETPLEPTE